MKTKTRIEWMRTRYELRIAELKHSLERVSRYADKTADEAQKMFDRMPPVRTFRRNGWMNEDERWAIAFYAQKLPRRTSRQNCGIHLYEIAAKFACSLPTVYKYSSYDGE